MIWLLTWLQVQPGIAQPLSFIHYSTNNTALPQDICYRLLQDKTGFLWVGTENGLVRFDGRDMQLYRQGFRVPFTIAPAEYDRTFLVATWTGGVYRLHQGQVQLLTGPTGVLSGNDLLVYKDIVILQYFSNASFYRYDSSRQILTPLHLFIANAAHRLRALDHDVPPHRSGQLKGAFKYGILQDHLIAYNEHGIFQLMDTVFRQVSGQAFDHILQAGDGLIYAARPDGIYTLGKDLVSCKRIRELSGTLRPGQRIFSFQVLSSGNILLQLSHSVFRNIPIEQHLYADHRTMRSIDLVKALGIRVFISDMIADRENGFWVSTEGQGLYHVFEPKYAQFDTAFSNPFITSLMENGNKELYIGTKYGLYQLSGDRIRQLYPGAYIGRFFREDGAIIAQPKLNFPNLQLQHGAVTTMPRNMFRTETAHYIVRENIAGHIITSKQSGQPVPCIVHGIPMIPRAFCEDTTGTFWQGCDQGLYCWRKGDSSSAAFAHPLLRTTRINQLLADSRGGVWVASAAGLFYLKDLRVAAAYNQWNGLSNSYITTILAYRNKLWIGTLDGLNILDFTTGRIAVYKKYDGLIASDVTALAPFSGHQVAVGSGKGLTIMDVPESPGRPLQPQLILESVSIDDHPADSRPVVAAYNSSITLAYNLISFIYPELVRFQYRLSDEAPWIETSNKSIVLTNVAPGAYQLQLRARKYQSDWSTPLIVPLTIRKPWWNTYLFYSAVLLLIVLLVYLLVYRRMTRIRKQATLQQQFAELRLKALQAQLNPHFISNTLSTIQYFILNRDEVNANDYLARFANLTRLLLESSRSRFIPLKDELQIITDYLGLEQLRLKNRFTYQLHLAPGIDPAQEWIPGVLLQPIVENSIHHGIVYLPETMEGHIDIRITKQAQRLTIEVTDNGIGLSRAKAMSAQRPHRSRSTEILDEISRSVNSLPGCFLQRTTGDRVTASGQISGTQVTLHCSINNQYTSGYAYSDH